MEVEGSAAGAQSAPSVTGCAVALPGVAAATSLVTAKASLKVSAAQLAVQSGVLAMLLETAFAFAALAAAVYVVAQRWPPN